MAWNQPGGGNGDRDPWGTRGPGQGQGPPDLDEVFRKLQAKLNRIFGGGGGPRAGFGGGAGSKLLALVVFLLVLGWALGGIYIVKPEEQAVVLRFGEFSRTTTEGPHWRPLFVDTVEKVNVTGVRSRNIGYRISGDSTASVPHESLMLTQDENIIDIKFEVQYRVHDPRAFLFNVVEPEITLRQATESAVREIVGKRKMDPIISKERDVVAEEAKGLIQDILDRYGDGGVGIIITGVNMQDAQAPKEVQAAYADAVKAREDEVRFINEAKAYEADIVPKARGDAKAVLQRAEAYRQRVIAAAEGESDRFLKVLFEYEKAPDITRARLYLEAVESVMANTSKVLVDVEGGNNLMYLPLDKLITPGKQEENVSPSGEISSPPPSLGVGRSDTLERERERRTFRGRSR